MTMFGEFLTEAFWLCSHHCQEGRKPSFNNMGGGSGAGWAAMREGEVKLKEDTLSACTTGASVHLRVTKKDGAAE